MMRSIDWEGIEMANKHQETKTRAFITKYIHWWLPCRKGDN
jgi:hypothetical protein